MGRAEDYIRENTKALKEPNGREYFEWISPDQAREAVEIAREEMISKLRKWVSSKNERDSFIIGYIDRHFDELLKQAMEDE